MKTKQLSMREIAPMIVKAGFTGEAAVTALAVIWAESGGNAYAVNINDHNPAGKSFMSMDVGLCQWNTFWHPDFSLKDALDPQASIDRMYAFWTDRGFQPWNAWVAKAHVKYMGFAFQTFASLRLL